MHEIALVETAARQLMTQLDDEPVLSVTMAIGPRVDDDVARTAWAAVVAGSPLATAALDLVAAVDELRCFDCGTGYEGAPLDPCPTCGGNGLVVNAAEEVRVVSWTV